MKPNNWNNSPQSSLEPTKVLIADDDEATRILLRMALAQWGYQVIEARDGEEAWKILQEPDPPHILTLDWLMPKLDGVSLCKRIDQELKYRPYIIFLTRMTGTENMIQGLESGADEFILKPFDLAELRIRIFAGERIIKYRQQLTEMNEKLQDYISNMKSIVEEKAKQFIPFSDLITVLHEVCNTLKEVSDKLGENKEANAAQLHKIQDVDGKLKNFMEILKGLSPETPAAQTMTEHKTKLTSVPAVSFAQHGDTLLNMERLHAFFGNDTHAIKDFVKTFLKLSRDQVKEIENSIINKDAKSAKYFFHLLGSASGNSGIMKIYDLCGVAEQKIVQSDWNAIEESYQSLIKMLDKLDAEMQLEFKS